MDCFQIYKGLIKGDDFMGVNSHDTYKDNGYFVENELLYFASRREAKYEVVGNYVIIKTRLDKYDDESQEWFNCVNEEKYNKNFVFDIFYRAGFDYKYLQYNFNKAGGKEYCDYCFFRSENVPVDLA